MHVQRLWSFLAGYVIIRVKGAALERLVNLAASRGVRLHDIRRAGPDTLCATTSIGGFRALRPLLRKLDLSVRIRRKGGLPFLVALLGRRKALAGGVFLFLATLYALSSVVWFVQVTGTGPARRQEVLAFLGRQGVRAGAPAGRLDGDSLSRALLRRFPDLTWAAVVRHGTLVRVELVEKRLANPEESAPRHLVARRDGLVTACLPLRGEPLVQPGETVAAGQILISGIIPLDAGEPVRAVPGLAAQAGGYGYLRAEGTVRARVWYENEASVPLAGTVETPTGRRRTVNGWRVAGWTVWLGPRSAPFQRYREVVERRVCGANGARIPHLPVEQVRVTFVEVREVRFHRGTALAERLAEKSASAHLRREAGGAAVARVSREVERTKTAVRVRLLWEVEEEIQTSRVIRAGEAPPSGLPVPNRPGQGSERRE